MLDVQIEMSGFDEFIQKLGNLATNNNFISGGFKRAVNEARETVIKGTPVGDPAEDEHPGLMKKSWQKPEYRNIYGTLTATVTNSVDYGMASNYGHWQTPGRYVPAIGKRLVHAWVPGTYALERSLDEADFKISPIIKEEIMKQWYTNGTRETFYDNPGGELAEGEDYYE